MSTATNPKTQNTNAKLHVYISGAYKKFNISA